jgi:hypothetical protein
MAHFKCVACRIRICREGDAADCFEPLCPSCGRTAELVHSPAEVLGFSRTSTTEHAASSGYASLARTVAEVRARRPRSN